MSNRKSASFHQNAKALIKRIPRGKVATYGQIAALAGQPRAARQVAWVLHTASEKDGLPWHRVINSQGTISLPRMAGYEVQLALLKKEGIKFDRKDGIDLARFQWRPSGRNMFNTTRTSRARKKSARRDAKTQRTRRDFPCDPLRLCVS